MKKGLLIGGIVLLLTGCGKTFGKGADMACTGDVNESSMSYKATHYVYLSNGKVNRVDSELNLKNKEDADEACTTLKQQKDKWDEAKEWKVTCEDTTVYVENYMTRTNNPKMAKLTKEDIKNELEQNGFTCK